MAKAEWETLRSLRGRKRLEQIWTYYKLPIFLVLLAIYAVCYIGYRQATRKNEVLYLAMVNVSAGQQLTEQLTQGFLDQQGLTQKDDVYLYNGLLLSEEADQQYVYASRMKIMGALATDQLDVVLMDAEARDAFLEEGYLADLRTLDPGLADQPGLDGSGLWLNVSDAPMIQAAGFSDKVYLGVIIQAPHPEEAAAFIRYLLS